MNKKRFIIEIGTGVDQHGQDATATAARAVRDAVSRVSIVGLLEVFELEDLNEMLVDVLIACPHPGEVDIDRVLEVLPFGQKNIRVVDGGMVVHGHRIASLGDISDEIVVANAAVTVSIDVDRTALKG